jgi:DNA-nicking Smr family endonuclease
MGKDKNRTLTPEEKKLWALITKDAAPIHSATVEKEIPPPTQKMDTPVRRAENASTRNVALSSLSVGEYAGVDRNTAERFRKGESAIDATLDLHGMTAARAHTALERFIQSYYAQGSRRLLVITGKGKNDTPGILRQSLPQWLNTEILRPMILAIDTAKPKHGGSGAYYVLLKRKR